MKSLKENVDDELNKNIILRFDQTLGNYLELSVGNDTYNLTEYDKLHFTDTTIIIIFNIGVNSFQNWLIK